MKNKYIACKNKERFYSSLSDVFLYVDHNNEEAVITQINMLNNNRIRITDLRNPTERVLKAFIKKCPKSVLELENPSNELLEYAILLDGKIINSVSNPTITMKENAIPTYWDYFLEIPKKEQTLTMIARLFKAVESKYFYKLDVVRKLTLEEQFSLIDKDSLNILKIKNPARLSIKKAIGVNPEILPSYQDDEELVMYALRKDIRNVRYLAYVSDKCQEYVMDNRPSLFSDIRNPNLHTIITALNQSAFNIGFLKSKVLPYEYQQYIFLNYPYINIAPHIYNLDPSLHMPILERDPACLKYIKNPTLEEMIYGCSRLKINFEYLNLFPYIDNPETYDKMPISIFRMILDSDYFKYLNPNVIAKCKKKIIRREFTKKTLTNTLKDEIKK